MQELQQPDSLTKLIQDALGQSGKYDLNTEILINYHNMAESKDLPQNLGPLDNPPIKERLRSYCFGARLLLERFKIEKPSIESFLGQFGENWLPNIFTNNEERAEKLFQIKFNELVEKLAQELGIKPKSAAKFLIEAEKYAVWEGRQYQKLEDRPPLVTVGKITNLKEIKLKERPFQINTCKPGISVKNIYKKLAAKLKKHPNSNPGLLIQENDNWYLYYLGEATKHHGWLSGKKIPLQKQLVTDNLQIHFASKNDPISIKKCISDNEKFKENIKEIVGAIFIKNDNSEKKGVKLKERPFQIDFCKPGFQVKNTYKKLAAKLKKHPDSNPGLLIQENDNWYLYYLGEATKHHGWLSRKKLSPEKQLVTDANLQIYLPWGTGSTSIKKLISDNETYKKNIKELFGTVSIKASHPELVHIQIENPINQLTKEQYLEYRKIFDPTPPAWFSELEQWEQSFLKEKFSSLSLLRDRFKRSDMTEDHVNFINSKFKLKTLPSTLKKIPGISNFSEETTIIATVQENGFTPLTTLVQYRASSPYPDAIKKSEVADPIAEQNTRQVFDAAATRCQARQKKSDDQIPKKNIPMIYAALMTINKKVFDLLARIFGQKDQSTTGKSTQQTCSMLSSTSGNVIATLRPVNGARETFIIEEPKPLNITYKEIVDNLKEINPKDPNVQQALNNYKEMVEGLSKKNRSSYSHHKNLFLASLEMFIYSTVGGIAFSTCMSGKDRRAILSMHLSAILLFQQTYGQLPKWNDQGKVRQAFIRIFTQIFSSWHHQYFSSQNAPGCAAIKELMGALPKDMKAAVTFAIKEKGQTKGFHAFIAKLNAPKYKPKKTHQTILKTMGSIFRKKGSEHSSQNKKNKATLLKELNDFFKFSNAGSNLRETTTFSLIKDVEWSNRSSMAEVLNALRSPNLNEMQLESGVKYIAEKYQPRIDFFTKSRNKLNKNEVLIELHQYNDGKYVFKFFGGHKKGIKNLLKFALKHDDLDVAQCAENKENGKKITEIEVTINNVESIKGGIKEYFDTQNNSKKTADKSFQLENNAIKEIKKDKNAPENSASMRFYSLN